MHLSASNQIVEHLTSFEGFVPWMYLDAIGLVCRPDAAVRACARHVT